MLKDSMIILKKEMKRIFTDRRLLLFLVVLPLVMMPLIYTFMGRASRSREDRIQDYSPRVAVVSPGGSFPEMDMVLEGLDMLNARVSHMDETGLDSAMAMITDKELELLVVMPERSVPWNMQVFHNSTADYSEFALQQFNALAAMVNDSMVRSSLAAEGISPGILSAVTVNALEEPGTHDLAREGSLMGKIIGMMVPFFVVIYLFANAMKVGLDTVAGEKERGTLAVLLVNQVNRLSIVIGKMLSVMAAAIVGALSSAAGLKIASRQLISMYSQGGETPADFTMTTADFIQFGVVVLPLAVLTASIVMLVSTLARNVKEGQGMIMPVYIGVMVMGITFMQSGDIPPLWMRMTPVFNSLSSLKAIFMKTAMWGDILFSAGTSLLLSGVLIFITLRMFNDERILFRV